MDQTPNENPAPTGNDQASQATAELEETRTQLADVRTQLAASRTALLEQVRASNPTIPAKMITGETPDEINASVVAAAKLFTEWQQLNANATTNGTGGKNAPKVPTGGAPAITTTNMTADEKIRHGLQQRRS